MGQYTKDWGAGFDPAVCLGECDGYDTECPKLERKAEGIARLAQVMGQSLGEETCGVCGCALSMLDATQSPPTEDHCPRHHAHTDQP